MCRCDQWARGRAISQPPGRRSKGESGTSQRDNLRSGTYLIPPPNLILSDSHLLRRCPVELGRWEALCAAPCREIKTHPWLRRELGSCPKEPPHSECLFCPAPPVDLCCRQAAADRKIRAAQEFLRSAERRPRETRRWNSFGPANKVGRRMAATRGAWKRPVGGRRASRLLERQIQLRNFC